MKIIILGAGQVGGTLAENLANEPIDITLVDIRGERLRELQDRLDIRTVEGMGSYPDVLRRAGADDCDLLIAVTNSDEINMVACEMANALFRIPKKIARIRSHSYIDYGDKLFCKGNLAVDMSICPEDVVTEHIHELIVHPGAMQVLSFAKGRAQLITVMVRKGDSLVGQKIAELRRFMPAIDTRVAAIYRQGQAIIPDGETALRAYDELFFLVAGNDTDSVLRDLRVHKRARPLRQIIIAGGGNIGERVALRLESDYTVKIIDCDGERCRALAKCLDNTVVLHGDAGDQSLLSDEGIESTDVFCALTDSDAVNIMASILAKRLGAQETITLVNKSDYPEFFQDSGIGITISPSMVTVSILLTSIRQGDVVRAHSLRRGAAEAIEAVAHGDSESSRVVGKAIMDIELPSSASIGALVRGEEVLMAHHDVVVQAEDHVILFLGDKCEIPAVERLFQVKPSFF